MISYLDALDIILRAVRPQPTEVRSFATLTGGVLAQDLIAPISIPPFDNAAMDGFALAARCTAHATPESPITLPIIQSLAAGGMPTHAVGDFAIEIMTGAPIPEGADAVMPVEETETIADAVRLSRPAAVHENLRFAGSDFHQGHLLAPKGTRIHAGHIAAMTAAGLTEAAVTVPPVIEVLTTGQEVSDQYEKPLSGSAIYNANTPYLLSALRQMGLCARTAGHIKDDPAALEAFLKTSSTAQIVLSTGAVSKGRWDFIPEILQRCGAQILFHRVAIKPGKPILFALLPDGRYYFGLPGNPVAVATGLRFFVQPLIRALLNRAPEIFDQARLDAPYEKKGPFRHFLKARTQMEAGVLKVKILSGQESFKIAPLCEMNAWAILEENQHVLPQQTLISIAPFFKAQDD